MIRFFHVYKRSVVTIFVALLACFVMTTFGVDMGNRSSSEYAIKVDDTEVSHQDFYREKRNVENNYRRMLGDMYDKFEQNLLSRLNEQLTDRMIADILLQRFAASQELYAGEQEIQNVISSQVFSGRFDAAAYQGLLADMGMNAREFEERIARDALKNQLVGIFGDISSASQREVRALYEEEETKYDVLYAELKPADFTAQVKDPGEAELQTLYESRQDELQIPASVAYEYAVLRPDNFSEIVEIIPEEVEAYYNANKNQFALPEELHLRQIQINYPKDADEAKKSEIREKIQRIQQQAVAGDSFISLAQSNSEDAKTAALGGDMGWIKKGVLSKELETAAFKLLDGELSDVIDDGSSFRVLKLEERKPEMFRPFEEVRATIVDLFRKREAPSYMAARAHDLFADWAKSGAALADFAAQNKLTLQNTNTALRKEQDPALELKSLTTKILDFPQDTRQIVELADVFVLVNVTRYEEAHAPVFANARTRLLELYRADEAKKLASQAANNLVQSIQAGKYADLKTAAEAAKLTPKEQKDIKRGTAQSGILASEGVRSAIFSSTGAGAKPSSAFEEGGRFLVVQVTGVKKPDQQNIVPRRQQLEEQASRLLAQNTVDSLVNMLKARAQVDVDQSILVER